MGFLKNTKRLLISSLIVTAIATCIHVGQAWAADDHGAKVTSPGGYALLSSKSQDKGSVKVIVKVRAAFTPESLLQETDKHAQRSSTLRIKDRVITELETKGRKPHRVHKYKYTPYIAMTVDSETLDDLLVSPDVIGVEEDIPVPPALDLSVPRIGATELHAGSITGSGVAVAILDTGVDRIHPFLLGSVVSEACYSSNDSGSSSLCPGGVEGSTAPLSAMPYGGNCPANECDHGTHVAGIVAGRSGIIGSPGPGVAPEAGIISIQVFSRFDSDDDCGAGYAPCVMSWSSDQMLGLERVYELRNTYPIASVNMSLGGDLYGTSCDADHAAMKAAIDTLRAAGIATVIAGGNNFSCGAISAPACISSAISVGATDDDDNVAYYSNSASLLSLLAPGSLILSSVPGTFYENWNGTSMAAPHVAGAWALMKQENPEATVDEILSYFTSTGLSVTDQYCSSVTKKRINVHEAYRRFNDAGLTVSKTGAGTGTVTSDLSGIDCGDTCSFWFAKDTVVTLSATADAGSAFGGWSGGGCIGTDPCTVNLSACTSVTALFRKEITIGAQITITGSGFGDRRGKVLIGDVAARIVKYGWADDTITCIVKKIPTGSPGIFTLAIMPRRAYSIPLDGAVEVKNPEIDTLSVDHGAAGAKIKIKGKFFGSKRPKPYLEYQGKNKRCRVDSWTFDPNNGDSEIVFVVPNRLAEGKYPLNVQNKVGTAGVAGGFTIDPLPSP